jgi:hypothetical protein
MHGPERSGSLPSQSETCRARSHNAIAPAPESMAGSASSGHDVELTIEMDTMANEVDLLPLAFLRPAACRPSGGDKTGMARADVRTSAPASQVRSSEQPTVDGFEHRP